MKIEDKKIPFKEKVRRGHYLYFLYYYLYTRIMDRRIAHTSLEGFVCNEGDEIFPVQSASYRILDKLLPEINIEKDDVYADIGCGPGRLMGYLFLKGKMGMMNYGVDINRDAAELAGRIFADKSNVKIIHGDATKAPISGVTVCTIYNPFGETVMDSFLDHLEKTAANGCRVYYIHAVYEKCFIRRPEKWKCNKVSIIQPYLHIPVRLCEYMYTGGNV